MTPKIEVSDLSKSFGRKLVLDGINFTIEKGESLVIIGGSGSGKSVLIKTILGLISPSSGSIKIDGRETNNISRSERNILMNKFGMLFQGGALFDSLTVWQNITFSLVHTRKISTTSAKKIALSKLKMVGLNEEVLELLPAELSGGMQKRVALARAIATAPEIIFFDEPTTGLDPIMADVINDLIIKCREDLGATTITITHDMVSAQKIADKIAIIYKGKIIWCGNKDAMYDSGNPYVDQFIHGKSEGPIKMEIQDH